MASPLLDCVLISLLKHNRKLPQYTNQCRPKQESQQRRPPSSFGRKTEHKNAQAHKTEYDARDFALIDVHAY